MIDKPGIYPALSFADYLAIPAVNASSLSYARQSMGHVKAALDGKLQTETAATKFGSLVHCLVLEPENFGKQYAIAPGPEMFPTKNGDVSANYRNTSAFKAWASEQAGRTIIDADEHAKAKECAEAIAADPLAQSFLTPGGQREVSLVWETPSGVMCKCRVDWLGDMAVDLKTAGDASDFEWSIGKLDYDIKGAFYRRGVMATIGEWKDVALVVVESSGYPGVRAARIDRMDLDAAEATVDQWLDAVRACQMSGVWPGYESPPTWKARRRAGFDDVTTSADVPF